MAANRSFLACLHSLQRFGGFWSCLSRKKTCSPTVQLKSLLQSIQVIARSENSGASAAAVGDTLPNPSVSLTDISNFPFFTSSLSVIMRDAASALIDGITLYDIGFRNPFPYSKFVGQGIHKLFFV